MACFCMTTTELWLTSTATAEGAVPCPFAGPSVGTEAVPCPFPPPRLLREGQQAWQLLLAWCEAVLCCTGNAFIPVNTSRTPQTHSGNSEAGLTLHCAAASAHVKSRPPLSEGQVPLLRSWAPSTALHNRLNSEQLQVEVVTEDVLPHYP